jgi:drug/metabolite transporter (DMT)-like permease
MQQASSHYLRGAVFGLAAVSIWAGWSAITRLAVITNLDAWDIPVPRFGVAGLLLLPIVIRRGLALDRLGWSGLAGLSSGPGRPMRWWWLSVYALHFGIRGLYLAQVPLAHLTIQVISRASS